MTTPKPQFFKPTLSFDGVAIIAGIIIMSVAYGRIAERVQSNSEAIRANREDMRTMTQSQQQFAKDLGEALKMHERLPYPPSRL